MIAARDQIVSAVVVLSSCWAANWKPATTNEFIAGSSRDGRLIKRFISHISRSALNDAHACFYWLMSAFTFLLISEFNYHLDWDPCKQNVGRSCMTIDVDAWKQIPCIWLPSGDHPNNSSCRLAANVAHELDEILPPHRVRRGLVIVWVADFDLKKFCVFTRLIWGPEVAVGAFWPLQRKLFVS